MLNWAWPTCLSHRYRALNQQVLRQFAARRG
jgi:hypothetical protein